MTLIFKKARNNIYNMCVYNIHNSSESTEHSAEYQIIGK